MTLKVGDRFGRFRIQSELGSGGMGTVYRATDERLQRDVAVKVLNDQSASDRSVIARFQREAKAVAGLAHPNIVALHDFLEEDGLSCAVMELLEGDTLEDRLCGGTLGDDEFLRIATSVGRGLAAAHESGVVHRDIKPSNIFLTKDGSVKLLDFGLATARVANFDGESETVAEEFRTQVGTVMGTVGYMSPEQVRGDATDARSDLFSLGAVLYEMATGTKAFHQDTAVETMTAILNEPMPNPARTDLPTDHRLYDVIRRCLAKEPAERFENAKTLLTALDESQEAATSPPTSRTPLIAGIVAVAAVSVAAVVLLNRGDDPPGSGRQFESVEFEFQNHQGAAPVTREDFEEYCAALVGRWSGEVNSVIGETNVTNTQEETQNYFLEFRRSEGGHALIMEQVSARQNASGTIYYNAASRQVRMTQTSSDGVVNQEVLYREGDAWIRHTEQTAVDGTIREFFSILKFSGDGSTMTIRILNKNADGESVEQTNVWHRVGG